MKSGMKRAVSAHDQEPGFWIRMKKKNKNSYSVLSSIADTAGIVTSLLGYFHLLTFTDYYYISFAIHLATTHYFHVLSSVNTSFRPPERIHSSSPQSEEKTDSFAKNHQQLRKHSFNILSFTSFNSKLFRLLIKVTFNYTNIA